MSNTKSFEQVLADYNAERNEIAAECEADGYPAHGSNYELRVAELDKWYDEQYPEYFG